MVQHKEVFIFDPSRHSTTIPRLAKFLQLLFQHCKWCNGKKKLGLAIDNGAAVSVVPEGTFNEPLQITEHVKSETYRSASGHAMPNLGEQHVTAKASNGANFGLTVQVAGVVKPFISVQEVCRKGNEVIFSREKPVIRNISSGVELEMTKKNGQYVVELEVNAIDGDSATGSTFSRPEQNLR